MNKHFSNWTEIKNNASKLGELSRFIKNKYFENKDFHKFIAEQNPDFFNNSKNPFHGLKKGFLDDPKDEGLFVDKYLCYLVNQNKKPNEIKIQDWQTIFSHALPALFRLKDNHYEKLSNFEEYYNAEYSAKDNWIEFVKRLSNVWETISHFEQLFAHENLKKSLDYSSWEKNFSIQPEHFEIDLWADGYIIDYKNTINLSEKCILQVFFYFSLLQIITKDNNNFQLKGIGIFNTYTNSLFKLDIDPENKEIPSFEREEGGEQEKKIILSEEQKDIVEAPPGPILINAGPGSGKTEVIGHRVKWLIEVEEVSPQDILLISYSNPAVSKLKEKIHSLIRDEDAIQEITISTFHKLAKNNCQKILSNINTPLILEIMTDKEAHSFIKKIVWIENTYVKDKLKIAKKSITNNWYDDFIFWAKNIMAKECIPESNIEANIKEHNFYKLIHDRALDKMSYVSKLSKEELKCELKKIFKEFTNWNARKTPGQNKQSWMFDEWLAICLKTWKNWHPNKTYKYVFVDEFQDTNILQYSFLEKICTTDNKTKSKNLCCIGDLDQSIFSFSGAFPEIFQKFKQDYENCISIKKIQINRRSTKSIVAISQKLISNIPILQEFQKNIEPDPKNIIDYPVTWIKYLNHKIIVSQIKNIIEKEFEKNLTRSKKKQFCLGNIAILSRKIGEYRSENYVFLNYINLDLNSWAQKHANQDLKNSKNICQLIKNDPDIIKDTQQHIMLRILNIGAFDPKLDQYPDLFVSITEIIALSSLDLKEEDQIEQIFFDYLKEDKKPDFFDWYKKTKIDIENDLIMQIFECKKSIQINLNNLDRSVRYKKSVSECEELLIDMKKTICKFSYFSNLCEMADSKIKTIAKAIIKQSKSIEWVSFFEIIYRSMYEENYYRVPFNKNKIQVMSIHKSKGKEFKYVFIVNLTQRGFDYNINYKWLKPYEKKIEKELGAGELGRLNKIQDIATLGASIKQMQDEEEHAASEFERRSLAKKIKLYKHHEFNTLEAIRTFYVAITRAEEHLYICSPPLDHTRLIHLISEDLEIIEDEGVEKFETNNLTEDEGINWNISYD